jgi:hypothetical protein
MEGRYKVNFLFDRDTWKPGWESMWLRLARPYAGDTHGLHLPLKVRVDWETGASGVSPLAYEFPGFADRAKYYAWVDKLEAQKRKHSKVVAVPDYTDQKVCGITVHFLPCDELQVSTSCHAYGSPDYPIKTPLQLPEPQSCPQ